MNFDAFCPRVRYAAETLKTDFCDEMFLEGGSINDKNPAVARGSRPY